MHSNAQKASPATGTASALKPGNFGRVSSFTEWDPLKEVIVGTADGTFANLTWMKPGPIPEDVKEKALALARKACPEKFYEEVREDLDALSDTLRSFGVTVHRPEAYDQTVFYSSLYWSSTSNNAYNARDLHLVVGNTVIESPSYLASRYYEATAFYPLWYQYFKNGFRWISAPKPRLIQYPLMPYYRNEDERVLSEEDIAHSKLTGGRIEKLHKLAEEEILFEAANTLRMGRDLLYLVSSSGNRLGAQWLQSVLGNEYRVHATDSIYRSSHIDSTVLALRPGLVVINSKRVNEKNCPALFDKWDKIYFDDVAPTSEPELTFQKEVRDPIGNEIEALGFKTNLHDMSSPWVGMNFLSVNPELVVVDERQTNLIKVLKQHKIECAPVRMRHIYTQGGGIHCATLDTVREGKLESYFD